MQVLQAPPPSLQMHADCMLLPWTPHNPQRELAAEAAACGLSAERPACILTLAGSTNQVTTPACPLPSFPLLPPPSSPGCSPQCLPAATRCHHSPHSPPHAKPKLTETRPCLLSRRASRGVGHGAPRRRNLPPLPRGCRLAERSGRARGVACRAERRGRARGVACRAERRRHARGVA
jgi:hypothetical protein